MRRFYYLNSLLVIFIIPSIVAFYFIYSRISSFDILVLLGAITIMEILGDIWATRHGKRDSVWIWSFNPKNTIGFKVRDVPVEEYLFYIFVTTYIIGLWELIKLSKENSTAYFPLWFITIWTVLCVIYAFKTRPKRDRI